tara:strand:+ start:314 stop:535 length:222 start_codon:yes stop_codon:yes gene_type:complete
MKKKYQHGYIESKTSGGAVYELGVKTSKQAKAIRRIAEPLAEKHWRNTGQSVFQLHRIYRVAEYLYKRQRRNK